LATPDNQNSCAATRFSTKYFSSFPPYYSISSLYHQSITSGRLRQRDRYQFRSQEVKETSFRIDGVFVPPTPEGIVYFCEVQFQLDNRLYERMLGEMGIYIYRYRHLFADWQAVVIYPSRSIEQENTLVVTKLLASNRIQRIYLDELAPLAELSMGSRLMLLTTLDGETAIDVAKQTIAQAQGRQRIIDEYQYVRSDKKFFYTLPNPYRAIDNDRDSCQKYFELRHHFGSICVEHIQRLQIG
jgi:predicted transposase/invertase (TIGR01784 family)